MAKWEKQEMPEEEAKKKVAEGTAKDIKFLGGGMARVKVKVEQAPRQKREKPKAPQHGIRLPWRIPYEIYDAKSALWRSGKVFRSRLFIHVQSRPDGRSYFPEGVVTRRDAKGKDHPVFVFNMLDSPSLKQDVPENGPVSRAEWSAALEQVLFDNRMNQRADVVGKVISLFTSEMKWTMLVVYLLSIPAGLIFVNLFHLVPVSVTTWVT